MLTLIFGLATLGTIFLPPLAFLCLILTVVFLIALVRDAFEAGQHRHGHPFTWQ